MWPASWNCAQLREDHDVAEVDVGRGRIDPELDAQRPALGELLLELPSGSTSTALRVRSMAGQC